jgi:hypothetical protein
VNEVVVLTPAQLEALVKRALTEAFNERELVPVRVIADCTHPAAGYVFSMPRRDFGVRLRQVIS